MEYLNDLKDLDGKIIDEQETFDELTQSELVIDFESIGCSGLHSNKIWYTFTLLDNTEISVYG